MRLLSDTQNAGNANRYAAGLTEVPGRRPCCSLLLVLLASFSMTACFSNEEGETFYGRVEVRRKQELRWSDGGLPRIFDPALASSAPDTDAVRAVFEGLTEIDSLTLAAVPAVAERWESGDDDRVWTFYLRSDARWSNGDPVRAEDFKRAWKRAVDLGERVPQRALLANLVGSKSVQRPATSDNLPADKFDSTGNGSPIPVQSSTPVALVGDIAVIETPGTGVENKRRAPKNHKSSEASESSTFGVEAVSPRVLRVRLVKPDSNFPALVAHTLFRPVHEVNLKVAGKRSDADGAEDRASSSESAMDSADSNVVANPVVVSKGNAGAHTEFDATISNGAFGLKSRSPSEVVLERSKSYRDAQAVTLETVRFIAASNTETTLALYRAGEIDVVTNATFEPLTIKLLAPHEDFRRTTFGALNYYVFNRNVPPFGNVRVREAFAIAIDRGRLTRDTLGGATEPAYVFLPEHLSEEKRVDSAVDAPPAIRTDQRRARQLLAAAGYPGGKGFPLVRLLINRNDMHRAVAQAVAKMWREELGVETEIIVKEWSDYEAALRSGDYAIARRSNIMQTPDEKSNIEMLFAEPTEDRNNSIAAAVEANSTVAASPAQGATPSGVIPQAEQSMSGFVSTPPIISTHEQALRELPGIPLYFASSYALVKPYILDFDQNLFDAPLLKRVRINSNWTPRDEKRATVNRSS